MEERKKEERMGREEMMPSNVTPMMAPTARAAMAPAWYSRVSWGGVVGGALVALTSWLLLNALGYAIGLSTATVRSIADLRIVSTGIGVWVGVSAVLSLFIGSYAASKFAGVRFSSDGLWHGLATWAFASIAGFLLSAFLTSGLLAFVNSWVSAVLGIPSTATITPATIQNLINLTTTVAVYLLLVSLLSLGGALLGSWLGSNRLSRAEAMREEMGRERMAA